MSDEVSQMGSMRGITVSREYGSGGGEIARMLADHLGWTLMDAQIIQLVAQKLGISRAIAQSHDEQVEGFAQRLFESTQYFMPPVALSEVIGPSINDLAYGHALGQVLRAAVDMGHVVIVGRAAQVVLATDRSVLHVRIVAPLAQRIVYVMRRESLDAKAAAERIKQKEHQMHQSIKEQYGRDNNDAHLYDIIINTGVLDLHAAVELVCLALARKAQKLMIPADQLGPASGLKPYPSRPDEIH
ncbi:cytidylate kinase-like family protein [Dictyobacter formicarum]|uniref:Cytidylate kinase n=1 Tax=Dictyobacter formicarum TaxID=2778368 RepID=A0ABQ3VAH1_9CHLR|nr:cytidylate kinase-like family protein [Dictyobacter formicarum]GHO82798.1 cytidylate kinase [Dictyobacter formicarum]